MSYSTVKYKYLLLLVGIFIMLASDANLLHAQNQDSCKLVVQGFVRDSTSNEALGYAHIHVSEAPEKSVDSDEQGRYVLRGLCPNKTYTLICYHVSCERVTLVIRPTTNQMLSILLPHDAHVTSGVVITEKAGQAPSSQARSELSGRALSYVRGQSLGQAMVGLSGVSVLQTGAGIAKPVIHGMHSNRVLILNNGIRQEGQQWGSEHAPEIDPFIASKITVIKGANTVRYGSDAIAGVILVEPSNLRDSVGFGGELHVVGQSNNRQGVISGSFDQNLRRLPALRWRLQGTASMAGNTRTPNYWMKNTGVKEYNFSFAAAWTKDRWDADVFYSQFNTDLGIFSGAHIGNLTDLERAFNSPTPLDSSGFSYTIARPYQHVTHELVKTRFRFSLSNNWIMRATYARQYNLRYEYDKHRPLSDSLAGLNRPELQYEITTHTGDLNFEHQMIHHFTGSYGVSYMRQGNTYTGRYFIPNYRNYAFGVYGIERWVKDSVITIEAGVRYDYRHLQVFKWENQVIISPVHEFSNLSGTVGAVFTIRPTCILSLNAGSAWRAPAVNELYSEGLHHGAAAVEYGDRNLKTERSLNLIANLDVHKHEKFSFEWSVYAYLIRDFIYLRPVLPPTLTIRGAFPTFRYSQADAFLRGMDFSGQLNVWKGLFCDARVTLLRAWNLEDKKWLIGMPADRGTLGLRYAFEDFKRIKGLQFGTNVTYVNKQFRAPINEDFVPPPSAYTLLGLQVGSSLDFGGFAMEWDITASNLLNVRYRDYMNRFRYYSDEMGRNVRVHVRIPITQKSPANHSH